VHEGYYKAGKRHGKGRIIDKFGNVYLGNWINGLRKG